MQPLEGITVVSLEQAVAAPFATRQLAEMGARVIKVERPGAGDFARAYDTKVQGLSSHFVWLNRSKESIALDLKDSADRVVLDALIARADVFLQNLAPGAAARLGLDAAVLRDRHPELIHVSISGYGAGGPYSDKKAYDLLVQCEAGLVSITGTAEEMAKTGISAADIAAGMYAYSSTLAAVIRRLRTGVGATIEVSMLEALGEWMGFPMYYSTYGGTDPARSGAAHAAIAPYGPYRVQGGELVFLGIQNEREWVAFCVDVLGDSSISTDPRFASNTLRSDNREALTAVIETALADTPADLALHRLEKAGIANARLRDLSSFADHEQLRARDRWRTVETEAGSVRALLPPAGLDGESVSFGPIPRVGEHTAAIRAELGF